MLSDSLKTGNSDIDEQHEQLLTIVEELKICSLTDNRKEAKLLFIQFLNHIVYHFTFEEMLMYKIKYPAPLTETHRQKHKELQEIYLKVFKPILANKLDVLTIVEIFEKEFLKHLLVEDKELAEFIAKTQQARIQL